MTIVVKIGGTQGINYDSVCDDVAVQHNRRYIGVELKPDYIAMHDKRMTVQRSLI